MMKWGHLPEQAAGRAQLSDGAASVGRRERERGIEALLGGGDGGIMCGEAGCLHCGFTSATSHPLFKTIINC